MILIAGGTKDSRVILERLIEERKTIEGLLVITATEYGKKLIDSLGVEVLVGKKDGEELGRLAKERKVTSIIDATHPYALEISKNLIELSKKSNLSYLRFERPMVKYTGGVKFQSMDKLVEYLDKEEGKILVTLGSNNVHLFKDLKNKKDLYLRVLPTEYAIKKCEEAGFLPKQIIGLQGPFSKEFNKSIYRNYGITHIITKESGATGGELEKVEAALELGLGLIILQRPEIDYLEKVEEVEELIERVKEDGRI